MVQMYNPNVIGKQILIDVKSISSDKLKTIDMIMPLMDIGGQNSVNFSEKFTKFTKFTLCKLFGNFSINVVNFLTKMQTFLGQNVNLFCQNANLFCQNANLFCQNANLFG